MLTIPQSVVGAAQPLLIPIASTTVDLTTALSARLDVLLADGTTVSWTPTIENAATVGSGSTLSSSANLVYVFVAGDLGTPTQRGRWTIEPYVTFALGTVQFNSVYIQVVSEFGQR